MNVSVVMTDGTVLAAIGADDGEVRIMRSTSLVEIARGRIEGDQLVVPAGTLNNEALGRLSEALCVEEEDERAASDADLDHLADLYDLAPATGPRRRACDIIAAALRQAALLVRGTPLPHRSEGDGEIEVVRNDLSGWKILRDGERLEPRADVEGSGNEMLLIASAIESGGEAHFKRCAVVSTNVGALVWSPRNSNEAKVLLSPYEAQCLAVAIRSAVRVAPTEGT